MHQPIFNTEDAAFAVATEPATFRHWIRIAREQNHEIGTDDPRPHYDEYDLAVFSLVRGLVTAGLRVHLAFNFAIDVIAEFGGADPDQPPDDLWKEWEGHELFLVNRGSDWGLHDIQTDSEGSVAAFMKRPEESLYVALRPSKLIREAIERGWQSREMRKERMFGT